MKICFRLSVLFLAGMAMSSHADSPRKTSYRDSAGSEYFTTDNNLHALNGVRQAVVRNAIGAEGRWSKNLLNFNGVAALEYDVRAGGPFQGYVTLKFSKGKVWIDCLYVHLLSRQNGFYVERAVCGLNKKLDERYMGSVNYYADVWAGEVSKVDTRDLVVSSSGIVRFSEFQMIDVSVVRTYRSAEWKAYELPETIVTFKGKACSLGKKHIFAVYDAGDLKLPKFLDVAGEGFREKFKRLSKEDLKRLISECPAPEPSQY